MKWIIVLFLPLAAFSSLPQRSYDLLVKTGKYLYVEDRLYPVQTRQWVHKEIHKLGLTVQSYEKQDISSARALIFDASERFISMINGEKSIRPFLVTYPFGASDIDLEIQLKTPSYDPVPPGEISRVSLDDGVVRYFVDRGYTHELVHEESYKSGKELLKPASRH